jgi:HSP20 family protein
VCEIVWLAGDLDKVWFKRLHGSRRWWYKIDASTASENDGPGGRWRRTFYCLLEDTMLLRTDPFRDLDRLTQQVFGNLGTTGRPTPMPLDAWREGDTFVVELDLPGVNPDTIDLDVERNVLTVRAERELRPIDADLMIAERPKGVFTRQLFLGEALDVERIAASYDGGVLSLRIPVAERAKPRKIRVATAPAADREIAGEEARPLSA